MLPLLSTTLRQVLLHAMPADDQPKAITFDQPTREAAARWSRPAINLYLYDVRENTRLRNAAPMWELRPTDAGGPGERRKAIRLDAHYLLTVWAQDPDDEQRLLSGALWALFRNPCLDEDALGRIYGEEPVPPALLDQPSPITLQTAQNDELQKPTDLWSVLSNDLRPAIPITVTFALQPFDTLAIQPVREAQMFSQDKAGARSRALFTVQISGRLTLRRNGEPLKCDDVNDVRMKLVERDEDVPVSDEGRYRLRNMKPGRYMLEVTAGVLPSPQRATLTVPAETYDIVMDVPTATAIAGDGAKRKRS